MNKIVSIKNANAVFLATVLLAGTIAAFSPSFMVGTAQAEPQYGMVEEYYYDQLNTYSEAMNRFEATYLPNNEDYDNEYTPDVHGNSYYNEEPYSYGDSYSDDMYSKYPTKDKKFECEEGPFTGFFVSDPIFCDVELPAGPQGPQGPQGPSGTGQSGPQGPAGPAGINQLLLGTNVYFVDDEVRAGTFPSLTAIAECDPGDFILNGGYAFNAFNSEANILVRLNAPSEESSSINPGEGWITQLTNPTPGMVLDVWGYCFDNPPAHVEMAAADVSAFQQPEDAVIIPQGIGDAPKLTTLENQQPNNSPELTALEKTTKLKTQWLELLP